MLCLLYYVLLYLSFPVSFLLCFICHFVKSRMKSCVVGIDLGTTTTYAAIWKNGVVEPLLPEQNVLGIESLITFTNTGKLIGKIQSLKGLRSGATVYETKRLIGRTYDSVEKEVLNNKWSFKVVSDEKGMAAVKVVVTKDGNREERAYKPEDIASFILAKELDNAKKLYGSDHIDICIITCPVKFSPSQRKATLQAGYLAGFENVFLVTEPTAAAIAFVDKFDSQSQGDRYYLVYDFGGGTFDASVLRRNGNNYQVLSTDGDDHLGGKDIDLLVMDWVEERVKDKGLTIPSSKRLRFKLECKRVKECLLELPFVDVDLDFCEGYDDDDDPPYITITRSCLSILADPIIKRTISLIRSVLQKCNPPLLPEDISKVFLMGGSSKLKSVEEELLTVFTKKQIINDSASLGCFGIAYGATIIAHNKDLCDSVSLAVEDDSSLSFTDISPYNIGIQRDGEFVKLIEKEAPMNVIGHTYVFIENQSTLGSIDFFIEQDDQLTKIGSLHVPLAEKVLLEEQLVEIEVKMISADQIDITLYHQYTHRVFHAVMNIGLNETIKNSLYANRSEIASKLQEEQEIRKLRTDILELAQLHSLKQKDSSIRKRIHDLEWKANNSCTTKEDFISVLTELKQLIIN